jgi:hypothetical protein
MKLIQVIGVDGNNVALFKTDREHNMNITKDIQEAYQAAKDMEDQGEEIYVPDEAEAILAEKEIFRVYTDEVNIDVL